VFSLGDYLDLQGFVARLRNFVPFIAMRLQIQRAGLAYAASEYDCRTRFNRTIKKAYARPLLTGGEPVGLRPTRRPAVPLESRKNARRVLPIVTDCCLLSIT